MYSLFMTLRVDLERRITSQEKITGVKLLSSFNDVIFWERSFFPEARQKDVDLILYCFLTVTAKEKKTERYPQAVLVVIVLHFLLPGAVEF